MNSDTIRKDYFCSHQMVFWLIVRWVDWSTELQYYSETFRTLEEAENKCKELNKD